MPEYKGLSQNHMIVMHRGLFKRGSDFFLQSSSSVRLLFFFSSCPPTVFFKSQKQAKQTNRRNNQSEMRWKNEWGRTIRGIMRYTLASILMICRWIARRCIIWFFEWITWSIQRLFIIDCSLLYKWLLVFVRSFVAAKCISSSSNSNNNSNHQCRQCPYARSYKFYKFSSISHPLLCLAKQSNTMKYSK